MKSSRWGVIAMVVPELSTSEEYGPLEDRRCQLSTPWLLYGIPAVGWCIPLEAGSRQDSSQQAADQWKKDSGNLLHPKTCEMWVMKF